MSGMDMKEERRNRTTLKKREMEIIRREKEKEKKWNRKLNRKE